MNAAFDRARSEALKSAEQFRLGAVVLCDRGGIVAVGRNRNLNACGLFSIHAEMDAVFKARGRCARHLVVVRVLRDNVTTAMSRPCEACARALAKRGVRKVTYTTGDPHRPLATMAVS